MIALWTTPEPGGSGYVAEAFISVDFAGRSYGNTEIDAGKKRLRHLLDEERVTEADLVEHRDGMTSSHDDPDVYSVAEFLRIGTA